MCGILLFTLSAYSQPVLLDSISSSLPVLPFDSSVSGNYTPTIADIRKPFEVGEIEIKGNTKTKDYII